MIPFYLSTCTQNEVVRTCHQILRPCQGHPARHSPRGKKIKMAEDGIREQHPKVNRPELRVAESEETGRRVISGTP